MSPIFLFLFVFISNSEQNQNNIGYNIPDPGRLFRLVDFRIELRFSL